MHGLNILLSIGQVIIAGSLIFLIDIQQTKNEGIGGSIGSGVTSSFKGKAGYEERLTDLTRRLAVSFFAVSILVALTMNR